MPSRPASLVTETPGMSPTLVTLPSLVIVETVLASFCVKMPVPSGRKSMLQACFRPLAIVLTAIVPTSPRSTADAAGEPESPTASARTPTYALRRALIVLTPPTFASCGDGESAVESRAWGLTDTTTVCSHVRIRQSGHPSDDFR